MRAENKQLRTWLRRGTIRLYQHTWLEIGLIFLFNLVYASPYLFSPPSFYVGYANRTDLFLHLNNLVFLLKEIEGKLFLNWHTVESNTSSAYLFLPLWLLTKNFFISANWLTFISYLLLSYGLWFWLRVLLSRKVLVLPAVIAGTFSQILMYEVLLGHLNVVFTLALYPWVLAMWYLALRHRRAIWALAGGITLGLAGILRIDLTYIFSLLLFGGIIVFEFFAATRKPQFLGLTFLLLATAFLLVLPTIISMKDSLPTEIFRSQGSEMRYSIEPRNLWIPVIPRVRPAGYLGLSVLFVIAAGMWATKSFRAAWYCCLGTVSVLLSLGPAGPLWNFFSRHIPFFEGLRVPFRILLLYGIIAAVAVGYFCQKFQRKWETKDYKKKFLTMFALASIIFLDLSFYVTQGSSYLGKIAQKHAFSSRFAWPSYLPSYPLNIKPEFQSAYLFPQPSSLRKENKLNMVFKFLRERQGDYFIHVLPGFRPHGYLLYHYGVRLPTIISQFETEILLYNQEVFSDFHYNFYRGEISPEDVDAFLPYTGIKYLIFDRSNANTEVKERILNIIRKTKSLRLVAMDGALSLYENVSFRGLVFGEQRPVEIISMRRSDMGILKLHLRNPSPQNIVLVNLLNNKRYGAGEWRIVSTNRKATVYPQKYYSFLQLAESGEYYITLAKTTAIQARQIRQVWLGTITLLGLSYLAYRIIRYWKQQQEQKNKS
jgi:hypothetical protein